MSHIKLTCAFAFAAGIIASGSHADILLLHNDNLIEGAVVRTESSFAVRDDRGNVRYVAPSQVAYRCQKRVEAFRWKRRRVDRDDIRGHVRLAQWCLKNDLPHDASDELLHVSSVAPHHGAIKALERQLKKYYGSKAMPVAGDSAQSLSPFVTASYRQAPGVANRVPDADGLAHEPPPHVISEFKRSVQPIFVNRCGQITCHGSASKSDFRLNVHRNRAIGRDMTTRNLATILAHLDKANVERSKLLKLARTPHATMRTPAIGTHEFEIYQSIVKWAKKAVDDEQETSVEPATTAKVNGFTPARQMLDAREAGMAAEPDDPSDFAAKIVLADPTKPGRAETAEQKKYDASEDSPPTDPFDPATFNERQRKK